MTVHVKAEFGEIVRDTQNVIADTEGGRADRTVARGRTPRLSTGGPGHQRQRLRCRRPSSSSRSRWPSSRSSRRTGPLRVLGGEEEGLNGSQFYVDDLPKSELKNVMLNLNLDMVGSPNFVRFVYDGDGSASGRTARAARRRSRAFQRLLRVGGPGHRADRVRRALRLLRVHQRGESPPADSSPVPRTSRRRRRPPRTEVPRARRTTRATTGV